MKRKLLLILSILTILSIVSAFSQRALALNVFNTIKEEVINQDDLLLDEISFKNTTKESQKIKIRIAPYDPKNEQILTTKPFVGMTKTSYTVPAGKEIQIPYAVSIPQETPAGTYFNVILFEEVKDKKDVVDANVEITPTIGALLAFHVQDSDVSINQIFFNQSDISLKIEKKGLPYISPTVFTYTYVNNSNFVFKPKGEIRILDADEKQVRERFQINEEEKAIYPGDKYEKTFEVRMWTDYKDILSQKNIIAKTYSNIDDTPVINKVTVSILNQIIVIGAVGTVIIGLLIYSGISAIVSVSKSKKEKKSEQ